MTTAIIYRRKGQIYRYTILGHSGYAEKGQDIVCAAITTLAITTVEGLKSVIKCDPIVVIKDGFIDVTAFVFYTEQALMETLLLGLESIQELYPNNLKVEVIEDG